MDRLWLLKQKRDTPGEIATYQIAEALMLPVRPWLAFHGDLTDLSGKSAELDESHQTGILVEWFDCHWRFPPTSSHLVHRQLVGRGLVLQSLNGNETAWWMSNRDQSEVYLHDLEQIGPKLDLPEDPIYVRDGEIYVATALRTAVECGVLEYFREGLRRLFSLDLHQTLDFSGHPEGTEFKRRAIFGLEARLAILRVL